MSKARQSKRQRYRKPRADYQAGGRVNARRGGRQFGELDALMPKKKQFLTGKTSTEKVKPINARPNFKQTNPTAPRPDQTLFQGPLKGEQTPPNYVAEGTPIQARQFRQDQAPTSVNPNARLANLSSQQEAAERLAAQQKEAGVNSQLKPASGDADFVAQTGTEEAQAQFQAQSAGRLNPNVNRTQAGNRSVETGNRKTSGGKLGVSSGTAGISAALTVDQQAAIDEANRAAEKAKADAEEKAKNVVDPEEEEKKKLLNEQARTNPKIDPIDVAKADDTILTGDEDIVKIDDPTNVIPEDAVKAKELTTEQGIVTEGELTDTEDTVTYDAVRAEGVDPTTAAQGTVDKDVVAGQATMSERAVAAQRDAEQEAAAKAKEQDYTISDDAFVDDVTFREGVTVVDTDPAEQQQRELQLGMPAPDGEAAQIINKYGFGSSKRPPRMVRGAKAKQQAAAQLATDHDLDPEVANQIMEDVEGFDVEGQSQESLGAVAALPKEALVSTQIENLVSGMEDGKPPVWARPAVAAVEQMMAARGLSASTVGRDALFNSIIQSAMPIAQANATALQQRAAQNLSNEQQALIQDRQIAASFLEKNAAFKQQMNIANLSNDQQMRLANLTSRNQNESENLNARQQTELANLNARLQTNLTGAKIAESMGVAQLSVDQQRAVANATMVAKVDMAKFSADQQVELANSKFMQTMTQQDLSNRQQTALQNATLMAQMDMTNASERTKASVANAQNYLQMNITNVNNEQQALITDQQLKQQRLLSDQSAINAAKQFNAKSENQNNQFMVSMANQMEQFNAAQVNAMEQFNTGEKNRMEAVSGEQQLKADSFNAEQINRIKQFDAELDFRAESWNAQNAQAIQQSNIEWRRKANSINTAAQNAVNATNAQMQFGMSNQAQAALWQQLRDSAHFNHQDQQSENDRKLNIVNAAMGNETLMTHKDFRTEQNEIWEILRQLTGQQSAGSSSSSSDARGSENVS